MRRPDNEKLYFNPRPREEGDAIADETNTESGISIHALVKRATYFGDSFVILCNISIHALVKRATALRGIRERKKLYFNPRPREEGDSPTSSSRAIRADFNPRPREEGDRSCHCQSFTDSLFQSTPS